MTAYTPMYTRILVPLDGSRLSEQALPTAICLARQVGGTLLLVRAIPARRPSTAERDAVLAYLNHAAAQSEVTGAAIEPLVVAGSAGPAIVRAAQEHEADLIVLTSRGEHGVRRILVGSVAAHVTHASSVPVLVLTPRTPHVLVPAQPAPSAEAVHPQPSCWAVVALDGSIKGERAAEAVAPLLWSLQGAGATVGRDAPTLHLHLVRVVDLSSLLWEASLNTRRALSDSAIERRMAKIQTEAEEYLHGAAQRIDTSVCSHAPDGASLTVTHEAPAHLSMAAALVVSARSIMVSQRQVGAVSIPCGVIALATSGRRGVGRRIFGGITEQIIQMTDLPVLVVPLATQTHDLR